MSTPTIDTLSDFALSRKPIPFKTFLTIYIQSFDVCTLNHSQGAQCLYNYLTRDAAIPLRQPRCPLITLPPHFYSYPIMELVKILCGPQPIYSVFDSTNWLSIIYTTTLTIQQEQVQRMLAKNLSIDKNAANGGENNGN